MKNLSAVHFIPAKINVDSRLHVICLNEKNHLFCHSYGYDDGHGWMWLK
ncbi:conserved domain protein [Prevotella denticola CRIS 18C-A]|uniref:Conserved domain protein n=1 Tax=Prevotella denticola CRIS 18C-A TaxID=944557 RepID=F0H503_9BACT|nr:conserved domain protein [Prevotella denticola CRIS 18C-A]